MKALEENERRILTHNISGAERVLVIAPAKAHRMIAEGWLCLTGFEGKHGRCLEATEAGRRALRVHAAYLASLG